MLSSFGNYYNQIDKTVQFRNQMPGLITMPCHKMTPYFVYLNKVPGFILLILSYLKPVMEFL